MANTTDEHMDSVGTQFRQVSGLPERKNDKPHDVLKPSELRRQPEPEGGLGGRGEPEVDERAGQVDEDLVKAQQDAEELSAKSGQGANEPGGAGASTSTEATRAEADAAGKSTAKKSTTKGKGKGTKK
jgi:hypothetical protein